MKTNFLYCIIALMLALTGCVAAENCFEDYSPCVCSRSNATEEVVVTCDDVSAEDVQYVFNRTNTVYIHRLWWKLLPEDHGGPIPSDVLSGKVVDEIQLYCPEEESFQLQIELDAFISTSSRTDQLRIAGCDLGQLDFAFLKKFDNLTQLFMYESRNVKGLENLPLLPSLMQISITHCEGLDELSRFPAVVEGFKSLYLAGNHLDDQTANTIISSILSTPAAKTLELLSLSDNNLTFIPDGVALFPQLKQIYLATGNTIRYLNESSLSFPSVATKAIEISLADIGLENIEPAALQGNFSLIYLDNNKLERFEQDVFQSILENMVHYDLENSVYIASNPIKCDCHLEWLIKHNRHLMKAVGGGTCSDSTPFEKINAEDLNCDTSSARYIMPQSNPIILVVIFMFVVAS